MNSLAAAIAATLTGLDSELSMIRSCLEAPRPRSRRASRRVGGKRRFWTKAEDREVRRLFPNSPTALLARRLDRSTIAVHARAHGMGLRKSAVYLASPEACRLRRWPNPGIRFRFTKGHVPANKGLRRPGWARGRMRETQFKKGQPPQNSFPVGTELRDFDGYLKRKVTDDRTVPSRFNWRYVHILTWEAHHGPIPRGHAVAFKNGDKTEIRIENLELVSRQELMRRNSVHNLPKALAEVVQLRGRLVRQIRKRVSA